MKKSKSKRSRRPPKNKPRTSRLRARLELSLGGLVILIILVALVYFWPALNLGPSDNTSPIETFSGLVIRVGDGDSIRILHSGQVVKIRLYGVDAPELLQKHGHEARKWLAERVLGQTVRVEVMDVDRYDRKVSVVYLDEKTVNADLVAAGQAWVYDYYCSVIDLCEEMKRLEKVAREKRTGLWSDRKPMSPWRWRRSHLAY